MGFSTVASLASLVTLFAFASAIPSGSTKRDDAAQQLDLLQQQYLGTTLAALDAEEAALQKRGQNASCTRKNLEIRLEFGSIAKEDRKAYTNAVLCLQEKKANTPVSQSSGARSRFDDFIVTHIQQTPFVHLSGTFLGWHRYYVWIYEQSLRTECGYEGPIPYWDWAKWADAPQDSPLFNGDEYSMGGNGEYIPNHPGLIILPPSPAFGTEPLYVPPGLGGGCVTTGPFKNMTVNLGPIALANATVGPEGGLGYTPRCLKRDVGPAVAIQYTNHTAVLNAVVQQNIADFQLTLQGIPGSGNFGVHGGGHYTIAGDPGGDFFVSPGDPAFYLHHGQIDHLWSIWQALDPDSRQYALAGTNTMLNDPPSANTTLDDVINVGYAGGTNVTVRDVMSTTKGPFCYIYL